MEMKKYKLGVPCLTAGRAFRGFAIASLLRNGYAAPTIPNALSLTLIFLHHAVIVILHL